MTLAALLLLALSAGAADPKDPFADKTAFWKERGFTVRERISRTDGALAAAVFVYAGPQSDRLEVYVAKQGESQLAFTHPSGSDRLELDASPAGRFSDMFGDGSRLIAYTARPQGLASTLSILRWRGEKVVLAAKFAEGRVERLGGGALFSARTYPLGRFFDAGCDDVGAVARGAYRTALYTPRGKRFERVDKEHPEFFEAALARKAQELESLPGGLKDSTGDYVSLALSMYFDESALGRKSEAWDTLRARLKAPAMAPRSVKKCLRSLETSLKEKLKV